MHSRPIVPPRHVEDPAQDQGTHIWRALAPYAALLTMLIVSAVVSLLVVVRETNRIDDLNARAAVEAELDENIRRLTKSTNDNAVWTEAALAVSRTAPDAAFIRDTWGRYTMDSDFWDGAVVLDAVGAPLIGYRDGHPMSRAALDRIAAVARPFAPGLPARGTGSSGGLTSVAGEGTLLVGLANIVPYTRDQGPQWANLPQRRLLFVQRLDTRLLDRMNRTLRLPGLRLVPPHAGARAITRVTQSAGAIGLTWIGRRPGPAAMHESLSIVLVTFLGGCIPLAFAVRQSLNARRALERLAHSDALTGLPNRAAFLADFERRTQRGGATLGLIDLNGFKTINDTYGHLVGDDLLVAFARQLAAIAMPNDRIARLGGDEFAFSCATLVEAERFAADLRDAIAEPLAAGPHRLRVGAAIGIAAALPDMRARDVIALADARLYRNKGAGRGMARLPVVAVGAGTGAGGRTTRLGSTRWDS